MLVGEAFGESEEASGIPFVGASGQLLNNMLHDAGIMRSECYVTNVVNSRPPFNDLTKWLPKAKKGAVGEASVRGRACTAIFRAGYESLLAEINLIKPDLIVALGGVAMWALTGESAILKWRGSQMYSDLDFVGKGYTDAAWKGSADINPLAQLKVIPTIHPAAVLREYTLRQVGVLDLRRAARHRYPGPYNNYPEWRFQISPSCDRVIGVIKDLITECEKAPQWIEFDLETSPVHITNVGISWSRLDALNIPITKSSGANYWMEEEEGSIIWHLYKLLTHPNCWVRGQNLLYDCQHTYRWWHWVPNVKQDTMLSHHTCFPGMKKSLDFQASMYADYYFWWKGIHKDPSNKAGA